MTFVTGQEIRPACQAEKEDWGRLRKEKRNGKQKSEHDPLGHLRPAQLFVRKVPQGLKPACFLLISEGLLHAGRE
jgi:hypothetical protein